MIRLLNAEQLKKATECAKASNLLVQRTSIYRQEVADFLLTASLISGENFRRTVCQWYLVDFLRAWPFGEHSLTATPALLPYPTCLLSLSLLRRSARRTLALNRT
jgi:hypothetical protein